MALQALSQAGACKPPRPFSSQSVERAAASSCHLRVQPRVQTRCGRHYGPDLRSVQARHGLVTQLRVGPSPASRLPANTAESLFVVSCSGNRPSHECAPERSDEVIAFCRRAGFQDLLPRGDTDFSLTARFDRWTKVFAPIHPIQGGRSRSS